jgi:hypothetical protein
MVVDLKKKIQEINKRWNITDDSSYKEEFKKFKTRVINIFSNIDDYITREGIARFCQILGVPEHWEDPNILGIEPKYSRNIINALNKENDEKKFYFLLEIIFILPFSNRGDCSNFLRKLKEAIELSNINLAITAKNDEIILYPRGEKELDEKLIDKVLSFLNTDSQKHFIEALRSYEKGTPQDAIKSAESLRRCLEEFLRLKLTNSKGLNANIIELQVQLKKDGRDPIMRNIIFKTLSYLDSYFNENSKHKDGDIDEAENEFLIYQIGVLMRYINKAIN